MKFDISKYTLTEKAPYFENGKIVFIYIYSILDVQRAG